MLPRPTGHYQSPDDGKYNMGDKKNRKGKEPDLLWCPHLLCFNISSQDGSQLSAAKRVTDLQ